MQKFFLSVELIACQGSKPSQLNFVPRFRWVIKAEVMKLFLDIEQKAYQKKQKIPNFENNSKINIHLYHEIVRRIVYILGVVIFPSLQLINYWNIVSDKSNFKAKHAHIKETLEQWRKHENYFMWFLIWTAMSYVKEYLLIS